MIHARPDYQRIQDPAGLIPADEPVFLLRAQDKTAPDAVDAWARSQWHLEGNKDLGTLAIEHAARMREWQRVHGSKTPDGPHPLATDGSATATNDPQEDLARRVYLLADRYARVAYPESVAPVFVPWEHAPDKVRLFYRELAGALLRGDA